MLADGGLPCRRTGAASALVAQEGALFPHLSVAGNIGFGLESRSTTRAERIDAAARRRSELDPAIRSRMPA